MLLKYKFRDKSYLREFFADSISRIITESNSNSENDKISNKKVYKFLNQYDIITPVPLHNKRKLERGYNQAEQIIRFAFKQENQQEKSIIQKNVNKKIKIDYYKDILVKVKNIKPQSTKSGAERKENIKDVFKIKNEDAMKIIKEKNILIFDDIYTTGSTFNECKKVLLENGAKKVGAFMIAKDF